MLFLQLAVYGAIAVGTALAILAIFGAFDSNKHMR